MYTPSPLLVRTAVALTDKQRGPNCRFVGKSISALKTSLGWGTASGLQVAEISISAPNRLMFIVLASAICDLLSI